MSNTRELAKQLVWTIAERRHASDCESCIDDVERSLRDHDTAARAEIERLKGYVEDWKNAAVEGVEEIERLKEALRDAIRQLKLADQHYSASLAAEALADKAHTAPTREK